MHAKARNLEAEIVVVRPPSLEHDDDSISAGLRSFVDVELYVRTDRHSPFTGSHLTDAATHTSSHFSVISPHTPKKRRIL
jgi:hypothetical protein